MYTVVLCMPVSLTAAVSVNCSSPLHVFISIYSKCRVYAIAYANCRAKYISRVYEQRQHVTTCRFILFSIFKPLTVNCSQHILCHIMLIHFFHSSPHSIPLNICILSHCPYFFPVCFFSLLSQCATLHSLPCYALLFFTSLSYNNLY